MNAVEHVGWVFPIVVSGGIIPIRDVPPRILLSPLITERNKHNKELHYEHGDYPIS
jgi:hypothetical protein